MSHSRKKQSNVKFMLEKIDKKNLAQELPDMKPKKFTCFIS